MLEFLISKKAAPKDSLFQRSDSKNMINPWRVSTVVFLVQTQSLFVASLRYAERALQATQDPAYHVWKTPYGQSERRNWIYNREHWGRNHTPVDRFAASQCLSHNLDIVVREPSKDHLLAGHTLADALQGTFLPDFLHQHTLVSREPSQFSRRFSGRQDYPYWSCQADLCHVREMCWP